MLYDILGPLGTHAGISDVVSGNNSVIDPSTGNVLVPGFTAAPGFDVASGWGTVDASKLCQALVAGTRATGLARSARMKPAGSSAGSSTPSGSRPDLAGPPP